MLQNLQKAELHEQVLRSLLASCREKQTGKSKQKGACLRGVSRGSCTAPVWDVGATLGKDWPENPLSHAYSLQG